ncbi:MAG: chondroitinase family polysaccharide lyase [Planctomycetota bacterium]
MVMRVWRVVVVLVLVGVAGGVVAEGGSAMNGMSFESGVPDGVSVTRGRLSVSHERWAEGRRSLRWDFVPGDSVTIRGPIGFTPEEPFPPNAPERRMPIGFHFLVFAPEVYGIDLRIEFGRGDAVDCWVDVRLIREGWDHFKMLYERGHLRGVAHPDMDFCRMTILGERSGTLYLDDLTFAAEFRGAHDFRPDPAMPSLAWHALRRYESGTRRPNLHLLRPWYPLDAEVSAADAESLRTIERRYLELEAGGDVRVDRHSEARMQDVREQYAALGIERVGDRINGPVRVNRTPYAKLSKRIGVMYRQTRDAQQRRELADLGTAIAIHAVQADFAIDWYPGRGIADGMYLLRDELASIGWLEACSRYLRRQYRVNRIYDPHRSNGYQGRLGVNSDYLYTNSIGSMLSILMMPDSPEKVRDLRHYVDWYGRVALGYAPGLMGALKPDGSHFHHQNAALHGYAYYTMHVVTKMCRIFSGTEFRLSREAHERLRDNLRIRAFYRTRRHFPMAYSQLVYPNTTNARPDEFAHMAMAGTPDGSEAVDREMAAHYLRFVGDGELRSIDRARVERFRAMGVTPAATPEGHHTLGYFAKAIHRRSDWMAVVGGHSQYVYKMELWPRPISGPPRGRTGTAFTQFVNHGTVEIIRPDLPGQSFVNNGFAEDGWDWRYFPGTTAIDAPLERIRNRVGWIGDDSAEHLFSDQPFVGGVHTSGGHGLFTGTFRGHHKYGLESMYATKSWFFFDDTIVCLGTGIRNDLAEYTTHTTLFQNALATEDEPTFHFTEAATRGLASESSEDAERAMYLVDNREVGYYVPAGQAVRVSRSLQRSMDMLGDRPTEGLFAKAWIDHGRAPADAAYEYAVLIDADASAMADYAVEFETDDPPYRVLRADPRAHVVEHRDTGVIGVVLFETDFELDLGPVLGVTHPSLLMWSATPDEAGVEVLELSVSDPNLRFYEGASYDTQRDLTRVEQEAYTAWWQANESIPSRFHVILRGTWGVLKQDADHFDVVQQANGKTVLEVFCQHGLTRHVTLKRTD